MTAEPTGSVFDLPELRGRTGVFADRAEGGRVLAGMLERYRGGKAIVMAIPAGGVPVGAVIARRLALPLELAVVSKITLPWDTEAGYGAVAFDGTVRLNDELLPHLSLSERQIQQGISATMEKVAGRLLRLRGSRPMPDLAGLAALLVDDGLASGLTMRVAAEALRKAGAGQVVVAVPTAHDRAIAGLRGIADAAYCANIRAGWSFAVADAYRQWRDLEEEEIAAMLKGFGGPFGGEVP